LDGEDMREARRMRVK